MKVETKTITLRMPLDMAHAIERLAESEDRSVNAQIVRMLREAIEAVQTRELKQ